MVYYSWFLSRKATEETLQAASLMAIGLGVVCSTRLDLIITIMIIIIIMIMINI